MLSAILIILISYSQLAFSKECYMPNQWKYLCPVIEERIHQSEAKMKLNENTAVKLEKYLIKNQYHFKHLEILQHLLPRTTIELLMAVRFRGVSPVEAESIAQYLNIMVHTCQFKNTKDFDNNTSHIIGRDWKDIDYSGEGMTWKMQMAKYAPYHITNFKTLENVQKFFPIESRLPYFSKIYKPQSCQF